MKHATVMAMAILACACGDPTPAPEAGPAAAPPVAIVTLPTTTAEAAPPAGPVTVAVARHAAQVRIRLTDLDHPAGDLTAELEALDTGEIRRWSIDALPAEGAGTMAVTVPAYAVGAGRHVLSVWAGDADLLRRYTFDVVVH